MNVNVIDTPPLKQWPIRVCYQVTIVAMYRKIFVTVCFKLSLVTPLLQRYRSFFFVYLFATLSVIGLCFYYVIPLISMVIFCLS